MAKLGINVWIIKYQESKQNLSFPYISFFSSDMFRLLLHIPCALYLAKLCLGSPWFYHHSRIPSAFSRLHSNKAQAAPAASPKHLPPLYMRQSHHISLFISGGTVQIRLHVTVNTITTAMPWGMGWHLKILHQILKLYIPVVRNSPFSTLPEGSFCFSRTLSALWSQQSLL